MVRGEPGDIVWENIDLDWFEKLWRNFLYILLIGVLIVGCIWSIFNILMIAKD